MSLVPSGGYVIGFNLINEGSNQFSPGLNPLANNTENQFDSVESY